MGSKKSRIEELRYLMPNLKMLWKKSETPKCRDFMKIFLGHVVGIVVLGSIGSFIRVINIPINNYISNK